MDSIYDGQEGTLAAEVNFCYIGMIRIHPDLAILVPKMCSSFCYHHYGSSVTLPGTIRRLVVKVSKSSEEMIQI